MDGSTNPSTIYNGLGLSQRRWRRHLVAHHSAAGRDCRQRFPRGGPSGTLYAAVSYTNGIFVSHDHAQTWTSTGSYIPPWRSETSRPRRQQHRSRRTTGTLYATINQVATSGFVTKLSADGSSILYSTYLRGHASLESLYRLRRRTRRLPDAELDLRHRAGCGRKRHRRRQYARRRFPGRNSRASRQRRTGGRLRGHAFGGWQQAELLDLFRRLPGRWRAGGRDRFPGNVILAGQTWSFDFPVPGGVQPPSGYGEAFVVKLAPPGPPAITSVLNGASYQPGIEAGSWVMIQGTNLANTFPGRTWRSDEIVNGNLPTSLDGVSVTIDGKPAFVYYISPTQINVQAPSDTAAGAVNVVVDNNGGYQRSRACAIAGRRAGVLHVSGDELCSRVATARLCAWWAIHPRSREL